VKKKTFYIMLINVLSTPSAMAESIYIKEMGLFTLGINVSVSMLLLWALVSIRQSKTDKHLANSRFDEMEKRLVTISRQNTRLQKENTIDGLTGIGNRAHFEITYKMEWDRAYRERSPIAMLMIDIDLFKCVNDKYGHTEGDKCLVAVAMAIRGCLHRASDRLMRYGGEEFAVLLSGSDIEGVRLMSKRILSAVRSLEFQYGFSLSVSIGGASLIPEKSIDANCFVRLVDDALYRAKDRGRDRYEIVMDNSSSIASLRADLMQH
jgi:diguanylate cyclase (GGDEF)-like protein